MRCDGLVAEVQDWAAGLEEVHARIAGAFARAEPRARVLAYLRGLLGQLERKNGWTLAEAAGEISPDGMQRLLRTADWNADAAGAGAHGLRLYDWTRIELLAGFDSGWARWLLARRSIPTSPSEEPELAFYVCAGPADTPLEQLIDVAGGRWHVEECFQAAKNEAGLASYQVRDYTAWYRHITLAMLAHAYLSATRAAAEKGAPQPEPASSSP